MIVSQNHYLNKIFDVHPLGIHENSAYTNVSSTQKPNLFEKRKKIIQNAKTQKHLEILQN